MGDAVRGALGAPLETADQAWVLRRVLERSGPDTAADELFAVWADFELIGQPMARAFAVDWNRQHWMTSPWTPTVDKSLSLTGRESTVLAWVQGLSLAFEMSPAGGLEPFLVDCLARLEQDNPSDIERLAFGRVTSQWLPENPDRYFPALLASTDRNFDIACFCFLEVLATGDPERAWDLLAPWFDHSRFGKEAEALALRARSPEERKAHRERTARDPNSSPWDVSSWVLEIHRENPAQALASLEELTDLRPESVAPSLLALADEDELLFQFALEAARQAPESMTALDWVQSAENAGEFGTDRRGQVLDTFAQWVASDSFRPDDEEHRCFESLAEQLAAAAVDGRSNADLLPVLEQMSTLHFPDQEEPDDLSWALYDEARVWAQLGETGRVRKWLSTALRHVDPDHVKQFQDPLSRLDAGLPPFGRL